MKRLVILAAVGLLAVTAAYGDASTAADALGQLFARDRTILLIPEPGGSDHVFTSLESLGSFGMFQNTNDYAYTNEADMALLTGDESTRMLKTPSATGEGRARVIFTNLTNFARKDTAGVLGPQGGTAGNAANNITALQLGTVSRVGPGNLAVGFAYQNATNETSCTSTVAGGCGGNYVENSEPRVDLSLGYGFKLGEAMALGFSLRYANAEHELITRTTPAAPAMPTQITNDDPWNAFRLAGAFRWDMTEKLSWNVRLTYASVTAEDNTMLMGTGGTARNFEVSRDTIGFMGRVNFFGENSDNEVFVGYASGSGNIDNAKAFAVDAMGVPVPSAGDEVWSDDATETNVYLGWQGRYRLGKADFSPALIFENITTELEVQSTIGQVTMPQTGAKRENTIGRFSIPFAARYWFTEKFAVGAGARWSMITDEDESTDINLPGQANTNSTTNTTKQSATVAAYRLFMRYGNEHFSGQLMFGNSLNAVSELGGIGIRNGTAKIDNPDSGENFDRNSVKLDTVAVMINISF